MTVKEIYVADDGTEFVDEDKCIKYEEKLKADHFKDTALLFSFAGEQLSLTSMNFEKAYFIKCKTKEAAEYMADKFRGWETPWSGVFTSPPINPGCWVFDGKGWVTVESYLEVANIARKILDI